MSNARKIRVMAQRREGVKLDNMDLYFAGTRVQKTRSDMSIAAVAASAALTLVHAISQGHSPLINTGVTIGEFIAGGVAILNATRLTISRNHLSHDTIRDTDAAFTGRAVNEIRGTRFQPR
jgi:hypothetical protein